MTRRLRDVLAGMKLDWEERADGRGTFRVRIEGEVSGIDDMLTVLCEMRPDVPLPPNLVRRLWVERGYDETGTWLLDPLDPGFKVSPTWVEYPDVHAVVLGAGQPETRMRRAEVEALIVRKHGRCTIREWLPDDDDDDDGCEEAIEDVDSGCDMPRVE